jgi:hypothetical protein
MRELERRAILHLEGISKATIENASVDSGLWVFAVGTFIGVDVDGYLGLGRIAVVQEFETMGSVVRGCGRWIRRVVIGGGYKWE